MNKNMKFSPNRIVLALLVGMVISGVLNMMDNRLGTSLYDNYHTIAYALVPIILVGLMIAYFWDKIRNHKKA